MPTPEYVLRLREKIGHGDEVQFLTMTYAGRAVGGQACVNDGESTEVGWFALDELPELPVRHRRCLADAVRPADQV